jgi:triphosphoribosyl-dephospho-CoA synthase
VSGPLAPPDIAAAAQLACLLEVLAPKPGNVGPGRSFADTTIEDFLASAAAIGAPLGGAGSRPLGETIRLAMSATRRWTSANTNLGLVLLLAPLARAAACRPEAGDRPARTSDDARAGLRAALRQVLAATTVADARDTYAAIRLAAPGGLGTVASQDVAAEPSVTLLDAMRLAADRDGIAREYATAFHATFEVGALALDTARRDGLDWNDAIVEAFLTLLAANPDTHIARRGGTSLAGDVTRRARLVLDAGGIRSAEGREALGRLDAALRDARNIAHPGTTADITAAAIFVVLLSGGWLSRSGGRDAPPR